MVIVQVYVKVKKECIDAFISETIKNTANSIKESGVVRFDFMQETENPQSFLLTEIYKDEKAPIDHKNTAHYLDWKKAVADMMLEPRVGVKYKEIFPAFEKGWISRS